MTPSKEVALMHNSLIFKGNSLSGNLVPLFYALNHHLLKTDLAILGEDSAPIAALATKVRGMV